VGMENGTQTEGLQPGRKAHGGASRLTRAEWLLLLVLAAVQFTHIIDFMIVMPLGPRYMEELQITPQEFGFMVSAYAFSASVAGLLAAWFIDRFDRKTALLGLYAGFTLGTLFCAIAPNYLLLLLARAVAGAFGGVSAACLMAVIGDVFPDSRRGTATGVIMSAFSVASIAGVPAGLYLAGLLGWRAPFAVLAAMGVPVLALMYQVLPPLRGHLAREHHGEDVSTWSVLVQPGHVRAYALMTMLVMSTFMIVPYMATYLVANTGRSEQELAHVYLWGGLTTLLTLTIIGRLADRFGKLPVFRVLALLTIVPILVVTNLPQVSLVQAVLVTTVFMVVSSGRMVPAMALITASAAPRVRGSFLSVNSAVQQTASGLAALVGGALLDKGPGGELTGFPLVGILATVAAVGSVWLGGQLRTAQGGRDATIVLDNSVAKPVPAEAV
jgi:predicted MFS family arabinose efflux permease